VSSTSYRHCGKVCTDRLTNYFLQGSYLPSPFLHRTMEQLPVRNIRVTLTRYTVITLRINISNIKSRHWKQPLADSSHFPSSRPVIVKLISVTLKSSLPSDYFKPFFILKFRMHFSFLILSIFPAHPALLCVKMLVIPSQIKIMATSWRCCISNIELFTGTFIGYGFFWSRRILLQSLSTAH